MTEYLDRWLSAAIRHEIEQRFYRRINEQASLERLIDDPDFMTAPLNHVGLFADHGVVHVRDVANQVLNVLDVCHGVLIPQRPPQRFAFMQGYGVLLAYFHDIGMVDFSAFGRAMHPEFAAQAVFDPALDDLIDAIWQENSGGLAWHLLALAQRGELGREPKQVLRELLSLSIGHSKSKVPVALLNDPPALRRALVRAVTSDLHALYAEQQAQKGKHAARPLDDAAEHGQMSLTRAAQPLPPDAFGWLTDGRLALAELAEDAIDTVRALRAADALRQRGAVLETSGHYQVFVDRHRGNSLYALRLSRERLYLLELSDPISAGEANIASSEVERTGDLRISFHRGSFSAPGAIDHAARCAALVVLDIQRDVIESFERTNTPRELKPATEMVIYLEETEDDPAFVHLVKQEIARLDAGIADRVRPTPSLATVSPEERARYLAAQPLAWALPLRQELLAHMARTGFAAERIDADRAFANVRLAELAAEEVLVRAGTPAAFVYVPLGPGLSIFPLGGYHSFPAEPWLLLGATGVVRGAERSATIVAERDTQVLMIPSSVYLAHWHHTLSIAEFQAAIERVRAESAKGAGAYGLLEKIALLRGISLFRTLDHEVLTDLAARAEEVHVAPGTTVIAKGSFGNTLFVVAKGELRVHDGPHDFRRLAPGDAFGELAALAPEARTASVTATAESSLLQVSQADLAALVDENRAVAQAMFEVLAGYVRDQTDEIARLRAALADLKARRDA